MIETSLDVRDAGDAAYAARAVLDENSRESIREANLQFLNLVAERGPPAGAAGAYGLPAEVIGRLAALDHAARHAVARCPYTLFNLRFEDAGYWQRLVADTGPRTIGCLSEEVALARTAIFLAWHFARSNALAAGLVLGMDEAARGAWRGLSLAMLDRVATAAAPQLSARFGRHPAFWPWLVDSLGPAHERRAEAVRLLGFQLLAAAGSWPGNGHAELCSAG